MRALWRDRVVAQAPDDDVVEIDGAVYFPPSAIDFDLLEPSETGYTCSWRGAARCYSIVAGDDREPDAAWGYPGMSDAAVARIGVDARDYLAFSPAVSLIHS